MITIIALLLITVASAYFDLRKRIIPNLLVVIGLIMGTGFSVYFRGWIITVEALAYCILAAVIMYLFYLKGYLGAGDVKLYAMLPVFTNSNNLLILYFCIFCVAAVLGLGSILLLPSNRKKLNEYLESVFRVFICRFPKPMYVPRMEFGRIPMAVPLAIGVAASIILDNMGFIDFYP